MALAALYLFGCVSLGEAVILYRFGDPSENTSAPKSDVAGSGWDYEGIYGDFLGHDCAQRNRKTAVPAVRADRRLAWRIHGADFTTPAGTAVLHLMKARDENVRFLAPLWMTCLPRRYIRARFR
ncbi:MAG: hypothetical protein DLM52_09780 [Chthoniobacterales bacterium]|nr:MAG: hypothetical protein DLM52_09780 [Chthoniobacterales bacterium]